jgi:hypothetical protein
MRRLVGDSVATSAGGTASKEKRLNAPTALVGCQVGRTAFAYQVRLVLTALGADDGYRVDAEPVIESPFLLRDASGEWHELAPGTGSSLAPVLDLRRSAVRVVALVGNRRGRHHCRPRWTY